MEMLANSRSKLERRRGVPMLRSHPGAEDPRVQDLAEWSPPQPSTQHLCAKVQSGPLVHLSKLKFRQISCPVVVWVHLPVGGVEDEPVSPVPV